MGNAPPTAKDVAAWIPPQGSSSSNGEYYDVIAIGMQEATWKIKKDKKGQIIAVSPNAPDEGNGNGNDDDDDDDSEESDDMAPVLSTQSSDLDKASMHSSSSLSPKNSNSSSSDTVLLRNLLQENLGVKYSLIKEYQRGQMRLYLFVRDEWVKEIHDIEGTAKKSKQNPFGRFIPLDLTMSFLCLLL